MHKRTLLVIALFLASVLPAPVAQQQAPQPPAAPGAEPQPPITFKVEINYVEIDAVVTDAQGNFVRGLTKDDFEVVEDRKPQPISVFSLVDIPVERATPPLFARSVIEPDVRTNRTEFNGRVFVLVLDDLHTLALRTQLVRAAVKQFIERFVGANDLVAIVQTGGNSSGAQDFTSNTRLLQRAVDNFVGRKLRSATLEKIDDYNRQRELGLSNKPKDTSDMQRAYYARNTLDTLKGVAEYMAGIRGRRKAVVYFGEGIDYDITNVFESPSASDVQQQTRDAIAAATRANVSFYGVDARGLGGLSDEMMELSSLPQDNSLGPQTLQNELRLSQDSLRVLAEETGGIAVVNQNDFRNAFTRIIQDNSSYYVLGYYPTNDKRDGRFRKLQVRVRRPGLQVRARRGYVAPSGRAATPKSAAATATSPELREALNSPVPVSGLGISAFAAAFKGAAPNAAVALTLEIDGQKLKFAEQAGAFTDEIEVSVVAQDANGKGRDGGHDVVKLGLRPQTYEIVRRSGVRLGRRLQLPPGRYQLRIGARESGSGALGSVLYDLEVPDFSKTPLSMSSIVLSSASASAVPSVNPDPDLKNLLPGPPTALREFPRNDTLAVFADVYDNRSDTPHRVSIRASVLSEEGKVVHTTADERKTEELQGAKRGGFGYTTNIPLTAIAPGRYVLRVEAESSLADHATVKRELEFTVR
jgi:VWFA-related protein